MDGEMCSLPLTAVHTGLFNLVVSRRDQGWAPHILPQMPWMGGARLPRGIKKERWSEGGRDWGEGAGEKEDSVPQGSQSCCRAAG